METGQRIPVLRTSVRVVRSNSITMLRYGLRKLAAPALNENGHCTVTAIRNDPAEPGFHYWKPWLPCVIAIHHIHADLRRQLRLPFFPCFLAHLVAVGATEGTETVYFFAVGARPAVQSLHVVECYSPYAVLWLHWSKLRLHS